MNRVRLWLLGLLFPDWRNFLLAIERLHQGLFAPYGFNVAQLFNNVWRAAGLEENGIVDITDGKT